MEVLFVRHGETEANKRHRHQMPEEPLSMNGVEQMRCLAPKISKWKPTHVITSPHQRSQQSVLVLADGLNIQVQVHDEFRELRRPIAVMGRRHGSLASIRYMMSWFFSEIFHHDNARQGESYPTFRKRIERARSILETYPDGARVVVVSHAVFINFFIEHTCRRRKISLLRSLPQLLKIFALENSAYIQLHYASEAKSDTCCAWQVVKNEIGRRELEEKRAKKLAEKKVKKNKAN